MCNHCRIHEDARSASYAGPTATPLTLSPTDREYIVKIYSRRKPGIIYVLNRCATDIKMINDVLHCDG